MINTSYTILFSICLILLNSLVSCNNDCITLANNHKNILVLKDDEILYPNNNGQIIVKAGKTISLACPGTTIKEKKLFNKDIITLKCVGNGPNIYSYSDEQYNIEKITCDGTLVPEEKDAGTCIGGKFKQIEIGFNIKNKFLKHITLCFDDKEKSTKYTHSVLSKQLSTCHVESSRPNFKPGKYLDSNLANFYTKHGQVFTLCGTYGAIPSEVDVFGNLLEIGHLVAKCDFLYDAQQKLTFQYINAAPQWKSFNGGNWKVLEASIRNLMKITKSDLDVYTGTFGILKLTTATGMKKDFYLKSPKNIPVPLYFWKVILHKEGSTVRGLAIIGMNNYAYNEKDNPCKNIIKDIEWLPGTKWGSEKSGYVLACDVEEFKKIKDLKDQLPTLPTTTGILDGKEPPKVPPKKMKTGR